MDLRWPIIGGTVLASAVAGIWVLEGAIGPAAAAGIGGLALEMALRRKDIAGLWGELTQVRLILKGSYTDLALAKDGMMAVHQALADGGGAKRKIKAMVDEMAVMQCQFG